MPEALAYAGLGASTVTGYLKRSTYNPCDGSYERFQASEGGKTCRHLFETMSRLRVTVELALLEQEPLSSESASKVRLAVLESLPAANTVGRPVGNVSVTHITQEGRDAGFPPVARYLDRLRDSLIATGEPAPTPQLLVGIYE
jgi:hypothetical protein